MISFFSFYSNLHFVALPPLVFSLAGMQTQFLSNTANVWHVCFLSHCIYFLIPKKWILMWLLLSNSDFSMKHVFGSWLYVILSLHLCKAFCKYQCKDKPNHMTSEFSMLTLTPDLPEHLWTNAVLVPTSAYWDTSDKCIFQKVLGLFVRNPESVTRNRNQLILL